MTEQNALHPYFEVGADGWCRPDEVVRQSSPNCDDRPAGSAIDLLLIHNISLPPGQFGGPYIADLFGNRLAYDAHPYFEQLRPLRVSSHFLIVRDGGVIQFVSANQRAWHAGVSSFEGCERCNDFSIGIELEGSDFEEFSVMQYGALAALTHALQLRYPLTAVAGHEHVAPGRKTDPGPFFDWAQYQQALAGHAPEISGKPILRFPAIDKKVN
ncbi:1,6-anhydro-N-acetylmuramyl-L-alanine amidase AmpD [Collimonas pratensis]|uniref:1,6-anhydro-N-acetylmuramyl-L-alanine amidase AmpD n=1 Tax=Collimonas pratensis TaxID=279113 RepID=UPI00143CFE7C|nr:1,6-anhydro-N-acetylmuramyl-L-alanine amidase AmpD [Collimonas pratensis]NKI72019.1 1,6-anhydro-N-acetylmuramyl-L-alanine amidase AmpD [Collimonas pratensis]